MLGAVRAHAARWNPSPSLAVLPQVIGDAIVESTRGFTAGMASLPWSFTLPRALRFGSDIPYRNIVPAYGGASIFHNPHASGNADGKYAQAVMQTLSSARAMGDIVVRGGVDLIETSADGKTRIADVTKAIDAMDISDWHYVFVVGGDMTTAEVMTGVSRSKHVRRVVVVPLKGGTANDVATYNGVPASPSNLVDFLKRAGIQRLDMGSVEINGDPIDVFLIHSLGIGISGDLFSQVENLRAQQDGKISVSTYLRPLAENLLRAKGYVVEVNGQRFDTGEIVCSCTTGLGGITQFPMPTDGLKVFFGPMNMKRKGPLRLTSALVLFEAMIRKAIGTVGFRELAISGPLLSIDKDRQIAIPPGESLEFSIESHDGGPMRGIRGALNGDSVPGDITHVRVTSSGQPVMTLASPESDLATRRRLANR